MIKRKARVTIMLEYDLEAVENLSPDQVLDRDLEQMKVSFTSVDGKVAVVRKEVL